MTGKISAPTPPPNASDIQRASANFARLMEHVAKLYCSGDTSSVSLSEARELAMSVSYVLGIANASPIEAAAVLSTNDPVSLWHEGLAELDARTEEILASWREAIEIMPPINNVALRDTLASLGKLRSRYDTFFAAHEVPCDIDYQLSSPVATDLLGLDYVAAWMEQLLLETRWIAQFDTESCIRVLERVCPDYRGLHVNLYDLLLPHENELAIKPLT